MIDTFELLPSSEKSLALTELARLYKPSRPAVLADFTDLERWGYRHWSLLNNSIESLQQLDQMNVVTRQPLAEVGAVLAVLHSLRDRAKLAAQVPAVKEIAQCK